MSTVTIGNSPFHVPCRITRVYGYRSSDYSCGYHTGTDFVPVQSGGTNNALYSVCNGIVANVINSTSQALGTQVLIYDTDRNMYWRYCHMVIHSPIVTIGQYVQVGDAIGFMGATGNVTGQHLHLEASAGASWICGTFFNPCTILGIPNEVGTIVDYDGSITPTPTPPRT